MTRESLLALAKARYGGVVDYPWAKYPQDGVLRHGGSRRWYGLVMRVARARLGLDGAGEAEILNVKCDPDAAGSLRRETGILPAYHMNKEHWITILLDEAEPERIAFLLDRSYHLTEGK